MFQYLNRYLTSFVTAKFSDWQGVGQNVARDIAPGRWDTGIIFYILKNIKTDEKNSLCDEIFK